MQATPSLARRVSVGKIAWLRSDEAHHVWDPDSAWNEAIGWLNETGRKRTGNRNLRKTLVLKNGVSPLGLLRNCLDHALNDRNKPGGVFEAVRQAFKFTGGRKLLDAVQAMNEFRNTRIAHQEQAITDAAEAKQALLKWLEGLAALYKAYQV